MILSEKEIRMIDELSVIDQNTLIDRIKNISLSAWDNCLDTKTIKNWLNNFTGEALNNRLAEQNLALWIVENFVYFTDRDVRELCKNLWWKYIHFLLHKFDEEGFLVEKSIDEKCTYIINNTIIQPLGNCGGSGTHIAYFFRQSNNIALSCFEKPEANREYKYIALIDDATLSGHQAEEYLIQYNTITDKEKYIITLISTKKAKEYIANKAHIISSIELDDRAKCFAENSYVFYDKPEWRNLAKKMCMYYGKTIFPRNELGFRNGQYALGFYYNIPNNSLPILWSTLNNWKPLFIRYFNGANSGEEFDDEKYV